MPRYGFRLFDATIRRSTEGSNGRKYHPMEACGTEVTPLHYRKVVAEVLKAMEKRLLIGEPNLYAPDDATEVEENAPSRTGCAARQPSASSGRRSAAISSTG